MIKARKKIALIRTTLRSLSVPHMQDVRGLRMIDPRAPISRRSDDGTCSTGCPYSDNGQSDCAIDVYSRAGC